MKILVTGSNGLIGAAIAQKLSEEGHIVFGLNRHRPETIAPGLSAVVGDIGALSFLKQIQEEIPPCDLIVHTAADRSPAPDAVAVSLTNCLGTQQLLALAQAWGSASFLFLSGVSVIGDPVTLPIDEEHPARPKSAYLASKLYGEQLVTIANRGGLPGASFRISAPVGPRMPRDRIVTVFVSRALKGETILLNGSGARRQDYVDVRDIASGVAQWIARPVAGVFNIASGSTVSNIELAEHCIALFNSKSGIAFSGNPDPEDAVAWEVSIEKARQAFDYVPRIPIEDSIRHIADELRNTGRPG
jgi:nucleoside-diphosphate-sugar epimerase